MDSMRHKESVKGQQKKIKEKDVPKRKELRAIVWSQEKELGSNDCIS